VFISKVNVSHISKNHMFTVTRTPLLHNAYKRYNSNMILKYTGKQSSSYYYILVLLVYETKRTQTFKLCIYFQNFTMSVVQYVIVYF